MSTTTETAIDAGLRGVYDPCSVAAGAPLNLCDMGLIREQHFDADTGTARIVMAVTSPACFLSENMAQSIREQLTAIPGVTTVEVRIDSEVRWTPDEVSAAGAEFLRQRRADRIAALQLRPRQWQHG